MHSTSPAYNSEFKNQQIKITCLRSFQLKAGKTTPVDIPAKAIIGFAKSEKVTRMSKHIDLLRNTDFRVRPNLLYVIEIGCIFNKSAKEKIVFFKRSSSNASL